MRKWNAILSAIILILFLIHGFAGALEVTGKHGVETSRPRDCYINNLAYDNWNLSDRTDVSGVETDRRVILERKSFVLDPASQRSGGFINAGMAYVRV